LAKVLTTIGITDKRVQNEVNLGLSCWNLVTGVTGALLVRHLNRRLQYLIAFVGMTIVFACWTGASANYTNTGNHSAATAVVALIFIYYGFYNLMMPLSVLLPWPVFRLF
jgi:hypothetical protein